MKTPESQVIESATAWAETVSMADAQYLPQELLAIWAAVRRMKRGYDDPKPLAKCGLQKSA